MKKVLLITVGVCIISIIGFIGYIAFIFKDFGAGTLGGFDIRQFPTSKRILVNAIDSLYTKHPEFIIPEKWDTLNDWNERGYDFLDTRIFYLSSIPEEMYYVSFFGDANDSIQKDSTITKISIRAVNTEGSGWSLEESYTNKEKDRIENRFDKEIIAKLERYSGVNAKRLK